MRLTLHVPPWAYLEDGTPSAPSPPQAEFMRSLQDHDRIMFLGGLGSGKTYTGAWALLTAILTNRQEMQRRGMRGPLLYVAAAPTYQDLRDATIPAVLDVLDLWEQTNGFSLLHRVTKTDPREAILVTGDTIKFVAADAGRYKGATVAGAWLDEGEESVDPMSALKLLLKRLRSPKAPRRYLISTTTPGTEGQGILPWWQDQVAEHPEQYALVTASTATNPAHQTTDYVEMLASAMSRRERLSRLEGQPQPPENAVFGMEFSQTESVARGYRWPNKIPDGHEVHVGLDWGSHYSALWIDHDPRTGIDVVFDELHIDGCQDDEFLDEVMARSRKRGIPPEDITRVWVDPQPASALRICTSRRYFRGRTRYVPRWEEGTKRESIEVIRWRLDPSQGERMLLVAPELLRPESKRGLVPSVANYVWQEKRDGGAVTLKNRVRQDHWSSHAVDALRQYTFRYRWDRLKTLGRRAASRSSE